MNFFKKSFLFLILLLFSALLLFGIHRLEKQMDGIVQQEKLRFAGDVSNAPPLVAFTSVALGSFRGIVADLLWLRSESLKNQKSYFEMIQLARWITDLQPNYSGGTAYLAWNLAYNISVTCSDPEDRWRWVDEGVRLIRDKAMLYNPDDPLLYRELAWLYLHKMGNVMDDAHLYYKNRFAMQMTDIMGGKSADWEAMAKAPANRKEFMRLYPADHPIWKLAAEAGAKNYDELFALFKSKKPAALPEIFRQKLPEAEYKALDAALRRAMLQERTRLEPEKMLEIDRKYGKMDWRVPESQAIYWASRAMEKQSGGGGINNARLVSQALQNAFRGGRIVSLDEKNLENMNLVPNLALADAAYQAYIDMQEEFEKDRKFGTFRSARINYLKDAIPLIYINGDLKKAEEFFRKLIREDGPQKQKTLDEFVMVELAEDIRDADVKKATAVIDGLIFRSIVNLVCGEYDAAVANERLARYIHRKFTLENKDIRARKLPPYPMMKQQVVQRCEKIFPPAQAMLLKTAVEAEKAEKEKESASSGKEQP